MPEKIIYNSEDLYPLRTDVFKAMDIPENKPVPPVIEDLYDTAFEIFKTSIDPKGMYRTISIQDFDPLYQGEGQNAPLTPLPGIYARAIHLALYAFTLGKDISDRVSRFINEKDYPLGFMLDRIASESADRASDVAEKQFTAKILKESNLTSDLKTLLYSPGYCGWHISAQKKIFKYLHPEQIGIMHNDSFLMTPIKSVSGALVAGKPDIHDFKNNFDFCRDCITFSCRERMRHK